MGKAIMTDETRDLLLCNIAAVLVIQKDNPGIGVRKELLKTLERATGEIKESQEKISF